MTQPLQQWHAEAWQLARAAIARGAHALLIAGARGLGKHELALALARSQLCQAPAADGMACGVCESCHWFAAGTHPDLTRIEPPASEEGEERAGAGGGRLKQIGVNQVRELGEHLWLSAHRNAGKVVIVNGAESLNTAAANALLKSLEEPPPGLVFLLVADRPAMLLPTVRSRCQLIAVRLADATAALAWLAAQGIADAKLHLALAGGAPMEALAIAHDPTWTRRRDFLAALAADTADPLRIAELYANVMPALLLSWLQKWTFDLFLARLSGRIRYHLDLEDAILRLAPRLDPVALSRLNRRLLANQRHVNHTLNARLFLEQLLIGYRRAIGGETGP